MVEEATIRRQLAEFQSRLARLDDERAALLDIVKGYEALLRATSDPDHVSSGPITFPQRPTVIDSANKGSQPVGTVSMRSAVAKVMRLATGPLHSREVLERALAMGAATTAKEPISVVDLVLLGLSNKGSVEKVAPRTWRWIEVGPRALKVSKDPTV